MPTFTELDDDGASESGPSFVIEIRDILLRVGKQGDQHIASQQFDLQINSSFEVNNFKRFIKSFADYKDAFTTPTR